MEFFSRSWEKLVMMEIEMIQMDACNATKTKEPSASKMGWEQFAITHFSVDTHPTQSPIFP